MAKEKYILVTGGAGYIGSHAVKLLLEKGHNVLVLDDLSTGHVRAVDPRAKLVIGDVTNLHLLQKLFKKYTIEGVMHFAGKISVAESVSQPLSYFDANITAVNSLLRAMHQFGVEAFVFSSTAAVYGTADTEVITEDAPTRPESPYGFSKLAAENLIRYAEKAYKIRHVIFRYFNVAGSYDTHEIGEAHPIETHLIPNTVLSVLNNAQMEIYGNDYRTRDGTCLRDYIHVVDLCDAHVKGIEYLLSYDKEGNPFPSQTINLGSKNGYTNKEVVETVGQVVNQPVNYVFGPRRPGDAAKIVASNDKAKQILNWAPVRDLKQMITDDYEWRRSHPKLYEDQEDVTISPNDKEKVIRIKGKKDISKMFEDNEIRAQQRFKKLKKANNKLFSKAISDK